MKKTMLMEVNKDNWIVIHGTWWVFERDRRSIAFLQIAILRSDKSRKVGQIATRCSVLRALLSIVSIAEYCERC